MLKSLVIDFTFVMGRYGERIIKELAIVDVEDKRLQSYHFQPPYTSTPEELNYSLSSRGASWNGGNISYGELGRILETTTESASAIYVYGKEKCCLLDKLLDRSIIDLTRHFDCPDPSTMGFSSWTCMHLPHSPEGATDCALRSACALVQWLRSNHLSHLSKPNRML